MKRVSILAFITLTLVLSGCNGKSKAKEQNSTVQRSDAAKAMDSELLPEGGGKKMPMF
ncbi:lipoprotein [Hydrogenimonas sp. SS33]|uniref:lipoprotein n=1 Tax=Hydrogenimonas leucolamina TaxID=2954236 RepID=UPI00336BCEC0